MGLAVASLSGPEQRDDVDTGCTPSRAPSRALTSRRAPDGDLLGLVDDLSDWGRAHEANEALRSLHVS